VVPALRRDVAADELGRAGVTGEAADLILDEGARERHESRVRFAQESAVAWATAEYKLEPDEVGESAATWSAVIAWGDRIGIGGPSGGTFGYGTTRHPAFAACGKGRKHASDGGAWSAAILDVARQPGGTFAVNPAGVYYISGVDGGGCCVRHLLPDDWYLSVAAEGLRRALGRPARHPDAPFASPPESAADWSAAYNSARERRAAARAAMPPVTDGEGE
jgi:hypothetical protein